MAPHPRPPLARDYQGVISEVRTLADVGWPIVLALLANQGMGTVDTLLVGRLGGDALAALGMANIWGWSFYVLARGTLRALEPTFTQAMGARDLERARQGFSSGLGAALLMSVPVMAMHLLAGPGLRLLGQSEAQIPLAQIYCVALAPGILAKLVEGVIQQAVSAQGRTRPMLVSTVAGIAINGTLAATLIYGVGPFGGWGVMGAGVATSIAQYLVLSILLWLVWDDIRPLWSGWRSVLRLGPVLETVRTGIPIGLQMAAETYAFLACGLFMGLLGRNELAGHTVAMNLALLAYMVPVGCSTAATARIGNLVGAGRSWFRPAAVALGFGGFLTGVAAITFASIPHFLAGLYTADGEVLAVAVLLIPLCGAFQLFDGLQTVAQGILRALGDLRWPAVLNLVSFWVFGIPIGYALAFHAGMGPQGIWVGLVVGLFFVAVLMMLRIAQLARRTLRLAQPGSVADVDPGVRARGQERP